ncbi:hypothetical protein J4709_41735 [Actinomadura sp. LCR2-06]|uniref:Uncharacterized protein n=2 Tax=Actinomadura violacea TaxID=2819934 RepID=A0ABS3S532_9ACTN|nr:hypothetical protein [Actinomadura violacea]
MTITRVTFAHASTAVIPPGKELVSDPFALPVSALERLAISLRFTGPTGPATFLPAAEADAGLDQPATAFLAGRRSLDLADPRRPRPTAPGARAGP